MDTKQPETLRIADDLRHSLAYYGREDAFTFNAYEAEKRLRGLHSEIETLRAGYAAAQLEIASLQAANLELERLCEATYVAQGADAYHHACEQMERHQKERAAAGKVVGTERSLCDGIAWLYGHIAELEAQPEAVGALIDRQMLTDLIAERLSGTYHCMRVWSAWGVGTMSERDFEDVGESDTPGELADEILAALASQAQPVGAAPVACTSMAEIQRMARGELGAMATVFPPGTAGFNVTLYAAPQPAAQALDAWAEPDHEAVLAAAISYFGAYQAMDAAVKRGVNVHGAMSGIIGATDNLRAAIAAQQGAKP